MRQQRDEYPALAENIRLGKWHIRYDVQLRTRTDNDKVHSYYDYEEFELLFDSENKILSVENINSMMVDYALNEIKNVNNDGIDIIQLESGIRTSASDEAVAKLVSEGKTVITIDPA